MIVIFYSDHCEYCKKLLSYLDKYNIKYLFKLINIDKNQVPKEIDIVPTIVDTKLNQPLKGKKAFEYLLNIKYFNNPTNNVEYIKELPPNPNIPEDEKAIETDTINLNLNTESKNDSHINDYYKENESAEIFNMVKTPTNCELKQIDDKKLQLLKKIRGIN